MGRGIQSDQTLRNVSIQDRICSEFRLHTSQHSGTCPSTSAKLVHPLQCREAVISVDTCLARLVELIREDIQHQLAIALRVDVSMSLVVQALAQRRGIDEVAIVSHTDAVRAVYVEGLSLRVCAAAGSGVS